MEASQLRIGNYVYRQSSKLIVDKSSVYQIENVNLQSALKYDPIPLTEEWVLDFGFIKDFHYYAGEKEITYKKGEFILNDSFVLMDIDKRIELKFVHSLQNIYFCIELKELICDSI